VLSHKNLVVCWLVLESTWVVSMTDRDLFDKPIVERPKIKSQALPLTFSVQAGGSFTAKIRVPSWIGDLSKAMKPDTQGLTANWVGVAWAKALKKRFPGPDQAKRIARATDHQVRTVQGWLSGQAPYLHVVISVALKLKDPMLFFEISGLEVPKDNEVNRQIDDLKRDM
jgi:hypothetical protein